MLEEIKRAFVENKVAILISIAILVISLILGYCLEGYLYSYLNPVVDEMTKKSSIRCFKVNIPRYFLE